MFDWIVGLVERSGYLGVALLMFAENLFPPIPSELIMPLAGFAAARGELGLLPVILAGSVGSLLGAVLWYLVGRWLGAERLRRLAARHGRWLTIAPEEVDQACRWFQRHGGKAVLIGRVIPAVRTLISVPAGIARMRLAPFLLFTSIGTAIWSSLLVVTGFLLEDQYRAVADYVNPVSNLVFGALLLYYLYRVATFRRGSQPAAR